MCSTTDLQYMNSVLWMCGGALLPIGPAVRADFRRLYPANAKTPTCCPSDDNRTKGTNSVKSARSLWWHVGPYFWPADLTRAANPIGSNAFWQYYCGSAVDHIYKAVVRGGEEGTCTWNCRNSTRPTIAAICVWWNSCTWTWTVPSICCQREMRQ